MAKQIEIKVKVQKDDYLKFVNDYKNFQKNVEKKPLPLVINSNEVLKTNKYLNSTLSVITSMGTVLGSMSPLSKALGLEQFNSIISSLGAIAGSLRTIRTAVGLLSKSLGWISLIVSAGSLIYDLGKKWGFFSKQVELTNKSLQGQVDILKDINNWSDKDYNAMKQKLNDLEEQRKLLEAINDLLEKATLSNREYAELDEKRVRTLNYIKQLEEDTKGISKSKESTSSAVKTEKESLTRLGQTYKEIQEAITIFSNLAKTDVENKAKWNQKLDEQTAKLYETFKLNSDLGAYSTSTIKEFSEALKAIGIETTEELKRFADAIKEGGDAIKESNKERDKRIEEEAKAQVKFIEEMSALTSNLTQSLGTIFTGIGEMLEGDFEKGLQDTIGAGIKGLSPIAAAFGGPVGAAIGSAVEGVWDAITGIWNWFSEANKKKYQEWLKREEEARKLNFEREQLLKEKEFKSREKELKLRDENNKRLNRNFGLLEDAFLQGIIGLDAYLRELQKKDAREKQIKEEQERLERDKAEKQFQVELHRLKEEFLKNNPDLVGKQLSKKTIMDLMENAKKAYEYRQGRAGGVWDWLKFGEESASRDYWKRELDKFSKILEDFNKLEERANLQREAKGLDRIQLSPGIQMAESEASSRVFNLNFEIKTIVDPADPSSLRKLTNSIIDEINKLRISGVSF